MKVNIIIPNLLLTLLLLACTNTKNNNNAIEEGTFQLTATVDNMEDGTLFLFDGSKRDTITLKNGAFDISGKLNTPTKRFLIIPQEDSTKTSVITLYLEPTRMQLSVDKNNLKDFTLKGSKTQTEYQLLEHNLEEVKEKFSSVVDRATAVYEKMNTANGPMKPSDISVLDSLDIYIKERSKVKIEFIEQNTNSYVSLQELKSLSNDLDSDEFNRIYNLLNPELKSTELGKLTYTQYEDLNAGKVGSKAKNFEALDLNGNSFSLENFKDKYVLIDFWASWCVPCRQGNPHLIETYNKYKKDGFEIIGVSNDPKNIAAWKKAIETDNIGIWTNTLINGTNTQLESDNGININNMYAVTALPTKVLLNPKGEIILRIVGGAGNTDNELDLKLKEIFKY